MTFFWNGNRSGYIDKNYEKYVELPSDKGISFNQKPEMQAALITDAVMANPEFDFARVNFANGDMVGHTGDLPAAILAVEAVDHELGRLMSWSNSHGVTLLVTADHGNCDEMFDAKESDYPNWTYGAGSPAPKPKTAHTLAAVPMIIHPGGGRKIQLKQHLSNGTSFGLGNVANTVVQLLGLPPSDDFLEGLISDD